MSFARTPHSAPGDDAPTDGLKIGRMNRLRVVKEVSFGAYLDGGELYGEILLPLKAMPEGLAPEDEVDVFLYYDSEDRIIATTVMPLAMEGEFAALDVVEVNQVGAFLDWGIPGKDLLVPFREQNRPLAPGQRVVVRVYLEPQQGRIVATTKIDKFLNVPHPPYTPWQEVELLIARRTDIGYAAIVDQTHWGLLYANEVFEDLHEGDVRTGYIKSMRPDGKIDLSLQKLGYDKVDDVLDKILQTLEEHGGFLSVTDKSSPETIYDLFGISKKTYKKAVGALFKQRLVSIDPDGIRIAR